MWEFITLVIMWEVIQYFRSFDISTEWILSFQRHRHPKHRSFIKLNSLVRPLTKTLMAVLRNNSINSVEYLRFSGRPVLLCHCILVGKWLSQNTWKSTQYLRLAWKVRYFFWNYLERHIWKKIHTEKMALEQPKYGLLKLFEERIRGLSPYPLLVISPY